MSSFDDALMRMLGTGSSMRERELMQAVTLVLFWLLDEPALAHWVHSHSQTDVGRAQTWRWRAHAEGKLQPFPADGFGLLARDAIPWRSK